MSRLSPYGDLEAHNRNWEFFIKLPLGIKVEAYSIYAKGVDFTKIIKAAHVIENGKIIFSFYMDDFLKVPCAFQKASFSEGSAYFFINYKSVYGKCLELRLECIDIFKAESFLTTA